MLLGEAATGVDLGGPFAGPTAIVVGGTLLWKAVERFIPKKVRTPIIEQKRGVTTVNHDAQQPLAEALACALNYADRFGEIENKQNMQGQQLEALCEKIDGVETRVTESNRRVSHDVRGLTQTVNNALVAMLGKKSE